MPQSIPIRRCAAFMAACLVVVWVGGSFLTAMFKLGYRLWLGAWPDTLLYGIVPETWTPGAASLIRGDSLATVWAALLACDVLIWLLVVPPLLLLPCLLLLRTAHGGLIPALRSSAKPFAPDRPEQRRPAPYPTRPNYVVCSMKDG